MGRGFCSGRASTRWLIESSVALNQWMPPPAFLGPRAPTGRYKPDFSFSARPVSDKDSVPGKGTVGFPMTPHTGVRHGTYGAAGFAGWHGAVGQTAPGNLAAGHWVSPGMVPHAELPFACSHWSRLTPLALA